MAVDMKELKALVSHLEGLREKRLAQQLEIGKLILPSRGLFKGEETECLRDANLFNPAPNSPSSSFSVQVPVVS